jgi:glycosyltransferase involved in cell wall biosynthesis
MANNKVKIFNYSYFFSFFRRADIFHVHWPDGTLFGVHWPKHLVKLAFFLSYVFLCKALRRPIVWTVHNIGAHESDYPRIERYLWDVFLPRVAWAIHLCPASLEAIKRLTTNVPPGSVIPHPHYRFVYSPLRRSTDPRSLLGYASDTFVVSSFGLIRPYKGFEDLIRLFRNWRTENVRLHISGQAMFPTIAVELQTLAADDDRISLDLRDLPPQELSDLVQASNVIVLPYNKIMNSGVAAAALSIGTPIIGPAGGCILDYSEKLGAEWVLMFKDKLTIAHLEDAKIRFGRRETRGSPNLSWMDPDKIGEQIVQVYERLLVEAKSMKNELSGKS